MAKPDRRCHGYEYHRGEVRFRPHNPALLSCTVGELNRSRTHANLRHGTRVMIRSSRGNEAQVFWQTERSPKLEPRYLGCYELTRLRPLMALTHLPHNVGCFLLAPTSVSQCQQRSHFSPAAFVT